MAPNFIRAALDSEFGAGGGAGLRGNKGVQGATPSTLPLPRARVDWKLARVPGPGCPAARLPQAPTPKGTAGLQRESQAPESHCPAPRLHGVPPPAKASYRASTRPRARRENRPDSSRSFTLIVPVLRPQVRVTPASQRPRSSRAFRRRDGPARGKRRYVELRG